MKRSRKAKTRMVATEVELRQEAVLAAVPSRLRLVTDELDPQVVQAVDVDEDPRFVAPEPVTPRLEWWVEDGPASSWRDGAPVEDCLWRFVQLGAADDEHLLLFARSYGVLGICGHDLPGTHAACSANRLLYPRLSSAEARWYWERPDDWRELASTLRSYLNIAYRLRHNQRTDPADWLQVSNLLGWEMDISCPDERERLAEHVSFLILVADLNTEFCWSHWRSPVLQLTAAYSNWPHNALFRVLVQQLVRAITAPDWLQRCERCANYFGVAFDLLTGRQRLCCFCIWG